MRRLFDKDGLLLSEDPGTQLPADGVLCARAEDGTPLAHAQWQTAAPEAGDLIAVMRGLDRSDASLWTVGGKPRVEACESQLGRQITTQQRNAAWAAITEAT